MTTKVKAAGEALALIQTKVESDDAFNTALRHGRLEDRRRIGGVTLTFSPGRSTRAECCVDMLLRVDDGAGFRLGGYVAQLRTSAVDSSPTSQHRRDRASRSTGRDFVA